MKFFIVILFVQLLNGVDDDFKQTFHEYLYDFVNDESTQSVRMPFEHSQAELKYCQLTCARKNLRINVDGDRMIIYKSAL